MNSTLRNIVKITKITVTGPQLWTGLGLFITILALKFSGIWVSIQMITWNKDFYDALEQHNADAAITQLGVFAVLTALGVLLYLISDWLQKRLLILWREKLTSYVENAWLSNKAYWQLRPGFSQESVDNPDQRIANDSKLFVQHFISQTIDLITRIVELFSYVAVLWTISSFALNFTLGGIEFSIPRYMVWAAFIYVGIASFITHGLGRPIKGIVFQQERFEADFRHALIQVREGANEIAQDSGEKAEKTRLGSLFQNVKRNWMQLANAEFVLGLFSRPYHMTVLRIPTFLALPAYFAGSVTLGGLMQLASAFSRVTTTLSWFIFNYRKLAEFAAVTDRLAGLLSATETLKPHDSAVMDINHTRTENPSINIHDLSLSTPEGTTFNHVPSLSVAPGERVWIKGASGAGKSTLLSSLSGLWPFGKGRIEVPDVSIMALPQEVRMFPESLLHTLVYPDSPEQFCRNKIESLMETVGLSHYIPSLALSGSASYAGLSGGEKQRVALIRAILKQPQILLMDESTSALDEVTEQAMFELINKELPSTTILCVAHSAPMQLAPYKTLTL